VTLAEMVNAATSGPWSAIEDPGSATFDVFVAANPRHTLSLGQDEATARLIASVPELAAVALAAEAVDESHQAGLPAAFGDAERLSEALAALRARLAGGSGR
jgi:hypothetical protein